MGDRLKSIFVGITWVHVLLAIVGGGAYFYFTLDQTPLNTRKDSMTEVKAKIGDLQNKIDEAKKFETEFEQRKKQYADLVKELQQQQGALPKQLFLPDLLNDIIAEARAVDIDIGTVNPEAREEKKELYSTLGVTLEGRATFLQTLVFLDRLAHIKRLVGVSNLSFNRDGDNTINLGSDGSGPPFPALRVRMKILAYRYSGT